MNTSRIEVLFPDFDSIRRFVYALQLNSTGVVYISCSGAKTLCVIDIGVVRTIARASTVRQLTPRCPESLFFGC